MQKRERTLAIIVGALAAIFVLNLGYGRVRDIFTTRENKRDALQAEVDKKEQSQFLGTVARKRLQEYEKRSLPPDVSLARTLYRNWLMGLTSEAKLSGQVTSQDASNRKNVYRELTFTFAGTGTLQQLTRFLYDFYSANHLHLIRSLSIKPSDDGKKLDLVIVIEALSIPSADPANKLKNEQSKRLAYESLAAYEKQVPGRDFFVAYTPPPAKTSSDVKPPEPGLDAAKHTTVSAILSNGEQLQVWMNNRTTGKLMQLSEGDKFEVGSMKGEIKKIDPRQVEVIADGKRMMLALGEFLGDAKKIE